MAKVLIIIPAYNEADNIVDIISGIKHSFPYFDIVVVNDGSSDATRILAEQTNLTFVINLPYNMGIGASVQTGIKFAIKHNYNIALQFDGDGQHMIEEITKIVEPIENNEADCVIGSRFIQKTENYKPASLRLFGIYILRLFSYLYVNQKIADQTSGFRAYNRKAMEFLSLHYPIDYPEPELIILLARNNFRLLEVFTQMRERQGGVSSIPTWKGPYYIIRVLLSMTMAAIRSRKLKSN